MKYTGKLNIIPSTRPGTLLILTQWNCNSAMVGTIITSFYRYGIGTVNLSNIPKVHNY